MTRLRCNLRSDLSSKLLESECLTIDVTLRSGEHCLVSSMYRPPNSEIPVFLASYSSLLCAMKKECPKGIIIGLDHNLDFLRAHTHRLTNDFIQLNLDFGMIPTITRHTRITNSSATLIDNIIVSQSLCGSYISSIIVNDMSDHLPTACVLNSLTAVVKEPLEVKSRDTRPKNLKALKAQLSNQDWSYELDNESLSVNMDRIHKTLTTIVDRCILMRTRKIDPKCLRKEPWLSAGIKLSIHRNKKLYNRMLQKEIDVNIYKEYNKTLRKLIRTAKNSYCQEMCVVFKSETKKLWGLINEISGKKSDKSTLIEYLQIDNIKEYGAKKVSNSFAKYFAQVGKKFANKIQSPNKSISEYLKCLQSNKASIFLHPTDVLEIKCIVVELPSKKSSRHDNISNMLLKEIIDNISEVLCITFNRSLLHGEFPTIMKLAEVVSLYKSKEHFLEMNYRPISLLTTISKILEKIF